MPTQLSQLKLTLALSCAPRCYSYVYRSSAVEVDLDRACFVLKKAERSLNLEGYLEGYQRTAPPRPEGELMILIKYLSLLRTYS